MLRVVIVVVVSDNNIMINVINIDPNINDKEKEEIK